MLRVPKKPIILGPLDWIAMSSWRYSRSDGAFDCSRVATPAAPSSSSPPPAIASPCVGSRPSGPAPAPAPAPAAPAPGQDAGNPFDMF